jgi:hypothetical protein
LPMGHRFFPFWVEFVGACSSHPEDPSGEYNNVKMSKTKKLQAQ